MSIAKVIERRHFLNKTIVAIEEGNTTIYRIKADNKPNSGEIEPKEESYKK